MITLILVRQSPTIGVQRWRKRCGSYVSASVVIDGESFLSVSTLDMILTATAPPYNNELPIPIWVLIHSRHQDAVQRRWVREVLPGPGRCSFPRWVFLDSTDWLGWIRLTATFEQDHSPGLETQRPTRASSLSWPRISTSRTHRNGFRPSLCHFGKSSGPGSPVILFLLSYFKMFPQHVCFSSPNS